jgi:hypothetical protein
VIVGLVLVPLFVVGLLLYVLGLAVQDLFGRKKE